MAPKRKKSVSSDESGEFSDFSNGDESDSDEDENDPKEDPMQKNWKFPVLGSKASRSEYEAALKDAQIKVGEFRMTIRKQQITIGDLESELKKAKNKNKNQPKETTSSGCRSIPLETDKRTSQYAKMFGVMHEPFVTETAFLVPRSPSADSMSPTRYDSAASKLQGRTAELYEVLPVDMHNDIEKSPAFVSQFISLLGSGRRSMLHQLRTQTAHQIFKHHSQYYKVDYDRSQLPVEFQQRIKFVEDRGRKEYSKYAPILFPDGKRNMKKIFRNPELTQMLKSILFGPASLSSTSKKRPTSRTQGKIWGITFVTPGVIALMAVLAIFLHSPDNEWGGKGAKSNIPYEDWFDQFKKYLIVNVNKPHIMQLFQWWNTEVFGVGAGRKDKGKSKVNTSEGESSGMDEAQDALDSDSLLFDISEESDIDLANDMKSLHVTTSVKRNFDWDSALQTHLSIPQPSSSGTPPPRPSIPQPSSSGTSHTTTGPPPNANLPQDQSPTIAVAVEDVPAGTKSKPRKKNQGTVKPTVPQQGRILRERKG